MKPLSVLVLCLLAIGASTVSGEAKRRKHYTSSSYLDSYQFPDQPRNGYYDQEESSGESYQDFMDRHYPTSNGGYGGSNGGYGSSNGGYGSSNGGYGGYNNFQIPSLAGGGSRFDLEEGSGKHVISLRYLTDHYGYFWPFENQKQKIACCFFLSYINLF